jgi:hypothetical protein
MTIHGPDSLQARNVRLRVAHTITAMSRGAFLYLTHTKRGAQYMLSDGTRITSEIAELVIRDVRVHGVGDGLFQTTHQAWKYRDGPFS